MIQAIQETLEKEVSELRIVTLLYIPIWLVIAGLCKYYGMIVFDPFAKLLYFLYHSGFLGFLAAGVLFLAAGGIVLVAGLAFLLGGADFVGLLLGEGQYDDEDCGGE